MVKKAVILQAATSGESVKDLPLPNSLEGKIEVKKIPSFTPDALFESINRHSESIFCLQLSCMKEEVGALFAEGNDSWIRLLGSIPGFRFIFLEGCENPLHIQQLLRIGIPGLISSSKEATDAILAEFSNSFYQSLFQNQSLLHAFETAVDSIETKHPFTQLPSAAFVPPDQTLAKDKLWGIFLTPENQHVLNWKIEDLPRPRADFPKVQEIKPTHFPPAPVDIDKLIEPRQKKSRFGNLKLNFLEKVYQNLFQKTSTSPAFTPPPSYRVKHNKPAAEEEPDFPGRIAQAMSGANETDSKKLKALSEKWDQLNFAFKQKMLVKEALKKHAPSLNIAPENLPEPIESAIAKELFALNLQLLEQALQAITQPQMRGLVMRKPMKKPDVGTYHALIIGVNAYADAEIPPLQGALRDAEALHQLLSEKYFFDHIQLLRDPDRDAIIDAFDELDFKTKEGDNVLIFYAGHGKWDEESQIGYWLPSNAHPYKRRNWIENSTIHNSIKRLNTCQHVLLISDSCFSGALLDTRGIISEAKVPEIRQEDKDMQILYKSRSRQILTSGAKEPVPDDSSFFRSLLETLQELTDDTFSTHELFYHVRMKVLNDLRVGQNPQVGKILHAGDNGGDFVFFRK